MLLQDGHYWTVDLTTRALVNITKDVPASFIDTESDQTGPHKPPFGVAGWTKNDAAVLFTTSTTFGSRGEWEGAKRLTDGSADKVRHRLVQLDPEAEWYDLAKPVYAYIFGDLSKRSGYAQIKPGAAAARLVWLDKAVSNLAKAKGAETYVYGVQDYDDSPDLFVGARSYRAPSRSRRPIPFRPIMLGDGASSSITRRQRVGPCRSALLPGRIRGGQKYP